MAERLLSQPSVTPVQHNFSVVPQAHIERSSFNRSHPYKTTFDAGYLIPVLCDEMLPGDTFNVRATFLARLATPGKPVMDNMFLESFFFFVPNRLLWVHWREHQGQQTNPGDSILYYVPTTSAPAGTGWLEGSLFDYFGIPTKVDSLTVDNLHGRAYNLTWNEHFRDEQLQNSVPMPFASDGPDNEADYVLLRRGKRKDYFTSCLPLPQKGPAVELPIGGQADLVFPTDFLTAVSGATTDVGGGTINNMGNLWIRQSGAPGSGNIMYASNPSGYTGGDFPGELHGTTAPPTDGYADLSTATPVSINSMRLSFQMQILLERDNRSGTRYTEIIRGHFGVISPDARLQRPEYLGGGSTRVNITPVPQTSVTAGTPQGNLAGFGTAIGGGHGFTYSATEHGVVLGLVSVRADLTYQQGLDRMWSRSTRYDFYMPALAHLGEQAVLNKEIYSDGTPADELTFGYQERWAEYRYKPGHVTGLFRSNATGTLDIWHLSQYFTALPALDSNFIQDDPPIDRVIAVPSQPHFILDAWFDMKCARPMPVYAVPGLIDHF